VIHAASCTLYKLIGPDSIDSRRLKELLDSRFGYDCSDVKSTQDGRPLSDVQMLRELGNHLQSAKDFVDGS